MTLRLAGLFADAQALWQRERVLVVPVAGMFFLVPLLGVVLLMAPHVSQLQDLADQAALRSFYDRFVQANLVPLALAYLGFDYGLFALLSLFLQGDGRTLGQVLALALRRLFPFLILELVVSLAVQLGLSLFLAPGVFLFARTWLAAPAYAARPEAGLIEAFRQGWVRSAGVNWVLLLLAAAAVFVIGFVAIGAASIITGLIAGAAGGGTAPELIGYLVLSGVGALIWAALVVLRVAAYRATEPRQGI